MEPLQGLQSPMVAEEEPAQVLYQEGVQATPGVRGQVDNMVQTERAGLEGLSLSSWAGL